MNLTYLGFEMLVDKKTFVTIFWLYADKTITGQNDMKQQIDPEKIITIPTITTHQLQKLKLQPCGAEN